MGTKDKPLLWRVAVNSFTFLCVALWYDAGFTQMKRYNACEVTKQNQCYSPIEKKQSNPGVRS